MLLCPTSEGSVLLSSLLVVLLVTVTLVPGAGGNGAETRLWACGLLPDLGLLAVWPAAEIPPAQPAQVCAAPAPGSFSLQEPSLRCGIGSGPSGSPHLPTGRPF